MVAEQRPAGGVVVPRSMVVRKRGYIVIVETGRPHSGAARALARRSGLRGRCRGGGASLCKSGRCAFVIVNISRPRGEPRD